MWFILPWFAMMGGDTSPWEIFWFIILGIFVILGGWKAAELIYWLYIHVHVGIS